MAANSSSTCVLVLLLCFLSAISYLQAITVELIHKASPLSSSYLHSEAIYYQWEYYMKLSIGTPPMEVLGIFDTGSDLIHFQCKPCHPCYNQTLPLFDPKLSSTYRSEPCVSRFCKDYLHRSHCTREGLCRYIYMYGDLSYSKGNLAREMLTLSSSDTSMPVALPNIVFGCGNENNEISRMIGLGSGPLSLISQMGDTADGIFFYCLVGATSPANVTSKIFFGRGSSALLNKRVVRTPIVATDKYLVTLKGITVGHKMVEYRNMLPNGTYLREGKMLIDSGTPVTRLAGQFYKDVESALKKAINLKPVPDPSGNGFGLCYNNSAEIKYPRFTIHFSGGDVEMKPGNTFIPLDGIICFGVVEGKNVCGNIFQNNFLMGFDLKNKFISFQQTDHCRVSP